MGKSRRAIAWTAGVVSLAVCGWGGYSWLSGQFSRDEAMMKSVSTDGEYLAIGRNFDTATQTYDYITLERASGSLLDFRADRVVELEVANLHEIKWKDARTLVVRCTVDKQIGSSLASQFSQMPEQWRDVKITYEATRELTGAIVNAGEFGGPSRVRRRH